MSRSIAYIVIVLVFATSMGLFIRSEANRAVEENASLLINREAQELLNEKDERVNIAEPPHLAQQPTATVAGATIELEVAQTLAQRARGLSGRDSLASNAGMLFLFEEPSRPSFWMKDTRFALDFLWIAGTRIVDTTENVPPDTGGALPTYQPDKPVDKVIEVNAGWIAQHGGADALLGTTVQFQNI